MAGDGYLRIGQAGIRSYATGSGPLPLLLIDIEPGIDPYELREASANRLIWFARTIIVRVAEDVQGRCETVLAHLTRRPVRLGRLHHTTGNRTTVDWWLDRKDPLHADDELITRARAVETMALLTWGDAVWAPSHYHFRLPSGHHSSTFIRLADGIRHPRDAMVLAHWLAEDVSAGVGVIADSATITPVLVALELLMREAGLIPGPSVVLDAYPTSHADVDTAVRRGCALGSALGVVTVTSTGNVRSAFQRSIERSLPAEATAAIHTIVDVEDPQPSLTGVGHDARTEAEPLNVRQVTWLRLADHGIATIDGAGESCRLCRDSNRARLVHINPRDQHGAGDPQRLMPSVNDATGNPSRSGSVAIAETAGNRALWQRCAQARALRLEAAPEPEALPGRAKKGPMAIQVRLSALVADGEFVAEVDRRLAGLTDRVRERADELGLHNFGKADVVLVPEGDMERAGFEDFWAAVGPRLAAGIKPTPVKVDGPEWPRETRDKLRAAESILVLCLGSVTGRSLQRLLVEAQELIDHQDYELAGVVIHARPVERRDWETLVNSFGNLLFPLWLSYLPDYSPLRDEAQLLDQAPPPEDDPDVAAFHRRRYPAISTVDTAAVYTGLDGTDFDAREEEGQVPLFWGVDRNARLTPHSIFGELDAVSTYVAVASAMQRTRTQREEYGGQWRVFDVKAMFRSYYDPLVLAAFLRWLRPHEAWWGSAPEDAGQIVREALGRATDADQRCLLPEMLLAAALGKVPESGIAALRERAGPLTTSSPEIRYALHALDVVHR